MSKNTSGYSRRRGQAEDAFGGMGKWVVAAALCLSAGRTSAQEVKGSSEGNIFGKPYAAISIYVKPVLPSRSGEPWFDSLSGAVLEPPSLRPEGLALRNGLLYVSGDWSETQNQIAVFQTNSWGELTFDHAIREPMSDPPPTNTPNNEWWGAEGLTFNTGSTGVGAGGSALVSVDNQQNGIGNTFCTIDATSGALSDFRVAAFPEDIAYGPVSQRFYLVVRSPNIIDVFDADMNAVGLSWALPSRTRGATVVSQSFGRTFTGDNTLTGDVILVVCGENTAVVPPLPNRLAAYKTDGTPIETVQDLSWVDLSIDNTAAGGDFPGPHTFQGIAVDETNEVIYIADDIARAVYAVKPETSQTGTASGPVFGRTWLAKAKDVKETLATRNQEPWFLALQANVDDPPSLAPEGLALRDGLLYVSGDWEETQNQLAVFAAAAGGALTFSQALQSPISDPPPDPGAANTELWGAEGLTFNTAAAGYGANASALVTVEDAQIAMGGSTRALLNTTTGQLSVFGGVGSASPDDIAYGPLSGRFYVLATGDVVQVWTADDPPAYTGTQFSVIRRTRGMTVISPSFAQYLLNDNSITQEVLLVAAKGQAGSASAPNNRLAAYSLTGILLAQQDVLWTRDAYPGQPLQEFEAIAVDEANRVIYLGDEKANGIFCLTVPSSPPPTITAPADISVHSDAGECQKTFATLPQPAATNNCVNALTITFTRSDGKPGLLDPYEAADSPITTTWTAQDNCGNTATDTQVITVSSSNEMRVDVELSATLDDVNGPLPGGLLNRCVRFEAWDCPNSMPKAVVDQVLSFNTDAGLPNRATGASVLVPCGVYTCLTVRDPLHTLRSTAPDFTDDGSTYSATFIGNRLTGGHWLVGGNVNDDRFIDVLDFGSFVTRFQASFGTGDTDCSTPMFHADISGGGYVFTEDFTFIQINFLKRHEDNCCGDNSLYEYSPLTGSRVQRDYSQPVRSIPVADLWRMGMGELGAADLSADGTLDEADMAVFAEGQGLDPTIPADKAVTDNPYPQSTPRQKAQHHRR